MFYLIYLAIVAIIMIAVNELGYGIIAYAIGMPLAYWLMTKAFETSGTGEK
jgi:hypothetical protein